MQEFDRIYVMDLFKHNPVVWQGLGGLADMMLFMEATINGGIYHWSCYFDSKKVRLQDVIKKGAEACENTKKKLNHGQEERCGQG